jgi:hypothetical protein
MKKLITSVAPPKPISQMTDEERSAFVDALLASVKAKIARAG